jgi:hypothetical protein
MRQIGRNVKGDQQREPVDAPCHLAWHDGPPSLPSGSGVGRSRDSDGFAWRSHRSAVPLGSNPRDLVHDRGESLVLPETERRPAGGRQCTVDPTISLNVRLKLAGPELLVRARDRAVLDAAMPEAAVDEDCDPSPRENNVRTNGNPFHHDAHPDSVTESTRVERVTHREFRTGVRTSIGAHHACRVPSRRREDLDRRGGDSWRAIAGSHGFGSKAFCGDVEGIQRTTDEASVRSHLGGAQDDL